MFGRQRPIINDVSMVFGLRSGYVQPTTFCGIWGALATMAKSKFQDHHYSRFNNNWIRHIRLYSTQVHLIFGIVFSMFGKPCAWLGHQKMVLTTSILLHRKQTSKTNRPNQTYHAILPNDAPQIRFSPPFPARHCTSSPQMLDIFHPSCRGKKIGDNMIIYHFIYIWIYFTDMFCSCYTWWIMPFSEIPCF